VRSLRSLTVAVALFTALVLQTTVVNLLPLPLAVPQLVVVVVVVVGLIEGSEVGAVSGFGAGLVGDLLSDHAVGQVALVLTLVGYAAGQIREDGERTVAIPLAAVAGGSAAYVLLSALVAAGIGDARLGGAQVLRTVLGVALYDVLVTPFVLPPLRALLVRLMPEREP